MKKNTMQKQNIHRRGAEHAEKSSGKCRLFILCAAFIIHHSSFIIFCHEPR